MSTPVTGQVRMDREVHGRLKSYALETQQSVASVATEAVDTFLLEKGWGEAEAQRARGAARQRAREAGA